MVSTLKTIANSSSSIKVGELCDFSKTEMYETLKGDDCVLVVIGYSDEVLVEADKHIWICDGGEKQTITSKSQLWNGEWETVVEYRYYNHFNWGQCGTQNGYFYDGVFEYKKLLTTYDYGHNVRYLKISK